MISKKDLKQEIEQLDVKFFELVFKLLQQFPHYFQLGAKKEKCLDLVDQYNNVITPLLDNLHENLIENE